MKRPRRTTAAKLRSWRVSIIRKRGQYLGTVEAPNEKAAEAAAVAEFDLSRRAASADCRAGAELTSRIASTGKDRYCAAMEGDGRSRCLRHFAKTARTKQGRSKRT
jgi:hypothetical protein